jgi:hypothetical protein
MSQFDNVASLIDRLAADASTRAEANGFTTLLHSVHQNVLGLLEEIRTRRAGEKLEVRRPGVHLVRGIMGSDGPILTKHKKNLAQDGIRTSY